jgi:hypothetical protein
MSTNLGETTDSERYAAPSAAYRRSERARSASLEA